MQFSCESCKTQLQIADEKVRGKRLIVRCKRCGAKIGISDPALAARPAPARPASALSPAAPARPAPARAQPAPGRRDSDTESTRAMDSDLLERALQASKSDEPAAPDGVAARAPAPAPAAPAPQADAPAWFAMIHGRQTGPMTRAELAARTDAGDVGPRTYLWKDGMDSWQRAKDLPEMQALFPQLPEPPLPPQPAPPQRSIAVPPVEERKAAPASGLELDLETSPAKQDEEGIAAADPQVSNELFPAEPSQKSAADLARWASDELQGKPAPAPAPHRPSRQPGHVMFESAAPPRSRTPLAVFVVLVLAVAAAAALWLTYGAGSAPPPAPEKKEEGAAKPAPPAAAPPTPKRPDPPAPAEASPAGKPGEPPPTGLTADQVRKKLDENKPALQGCVDEALRRDPNLRVGKIHIATTIAPSGQVTQAKIDKGAVEQSALGACLRRATRRIAFPAFSGDAFDVDIPIVVTAGE